MRRMQDFRKTLRTQPLSRTYALTGKGKGASRRSLSGMQTANYLQKRRYFRSVLPWRSAGMRCVPFPHSTEESSHEHQRQPVQKDRQQAMEQGKITVKDGVSHYVSAFEPRARHPVFEMRLSLASEVGMRLFLSTCEPAQRSLYSLYCLAPIVMRDDTAMLDDTLNIVEQRFEAIETDLNNEWQRLRQVAETDGADGAARYVREVPLIVDVMTPAMARYLGLVSTMDGMTRTLDALWFAMRVQATERNKMMLNWRNQIVRFQRELSRLQKRLFEAVRRKSEGQTDSDASADAEVAEAFALAESGVLDDADEGEDDADSGGTSAPPEPDLSVASTSTRHKPATRKRAVADVPEAVAA